MKPCTFSMRSPAGNTELNLETKMSGVGFAGLWMRVRAHGSKIPWFIASLSYACARLSAGRYVGGDRHGGS